MDDREKEYIESITPLTVKEVDELLRACLQGPLPQKTVYRMMATLADRQTLAKQLVELQTRFEAAQKAVLRNQELDLYECMQVYCTSAGREEYGKLKRDEKLFERTTKDLATARTEIEQLTEKLKQTTEGE